MRKIVLKICSLAMALTAVFSFGGCSLFGEKEVINAYDIAVKNGFEGTEKEWLQSLKGADGKDAEDVDLREVYDDLVATDAYTGSYEDFLKAYFSVDVSEDNDTVQIAKNMMSVVAVQSAWDKYGGSSQVDSAAGSGVIIDLDKANGNAYVITNYHVVYNANSYNATGIADYVYLYLYGATMSETVLGGGDSIPATVVGGSLTYDIAVLEIEGSNLLKNSCATEAKIGDSDETNLGEKVFVMGNPAAKGLSVTSGALSKVSEEITMSMDVKNYVGTIRQSFTYRVMRTDAPINGGNSGGAMFNAKGELIAIVNAKTVSEEIDNMGYALPINNAYAVAQNIIANGTVQYADLGLTLAVDSSTAYLDESENIRIKDTITVDAVAYGSASNGKLSSGDVLQTIALNGVEYQLDRYFEVEDVMLLAKVGDNVVITATSQGLFGTTTHTANITLTADDFVSVV